VVIDLAQVRGQEAAKRALEVAAAGGHTIALVGPGGAGKSMLARCLPGLLPAVGEERPVRSPQSSVTAKALRSKLDLAAGGTLILDDLPLLRPATLRVLAEALERGVPAQIVATMRPCPCGHLGDRLHECGCRTGTVRHRARVAPVLDRLDLIVAVPALTLGELRARARECSARVAARVAAAREIQTHRGGLNAAMGPAEIPAHCPLDSPARQLLDTAFERLAMSAAALHRVLRVARTLADLGGVERLGVAHVAEAVQYRGERVGW
jgi:magnesium chelatase family protein